MYVRGCRAPVIRTATGSTREFQGNCTFEEGIGGCHGAALLRVLHAAGSLAVGVATPHLRRWRLPPTRLSTRLTAPPGRPLAHPQTIKTRAATRLPRWPTMGVCNSAASSAVGDAPALRPRWMRAVPRPPGTPLTLFVAAVPTGASAGCAASVWDGRSCNFISAAGLAHRLTNQSGKTACNIGAIGSSPLAVPATVPGDLVTDLQRAGVVGNPLFNTNFQNSTAWSGGTWTFSKVFALPAQMQGPGVSVLLVFDGIKMGATVMVNGHMLGNTTNQHRRWVYPLGSAVLGEAASHTVTVVFDHAITTEGRYMDCSGGWDWAPYSFMRDADGNPAFTRGIWKGVYLAGFETASAAITYVVPQVRYTGGDYPTTPLQDGKAPFAVDTKVFLHAADNVTGTVVVRGEWGAEKQQPVTLQVSANC